MRLEKVETLGIVIDKIFVKIFETHLELFVQLFVRLSFLLKFSLSTILNLPVLTELFNHGTQDLTKSFLCEFSVDNLGRRK